jgi:hypothetical protein
MLTIERVTEERIVVLPKIDNSTKWLKKKWKTN